MKQEKLFTITPVNGLYKRKSLLKGIAVLLVMSLSFQVFYPTAAYALTSGPGQPEFSSFEPASTSDMVDLYTGDFTYNIPLLSIPGPNGGYPINLAYHSGVGVDEEASWVGLGWTLNVGAINRQMRGVPDDFAGEDITHKYHTRRDWTVGLDVNPLWEKVEAFGFPYNIADVNNNPFSWSTQIYYNNFRGLGNRLSLNFSRKKSGYVNPGLGINIDSQNGISLSPSLGVGGVLKKFGLNFSTSINNRSGSQGVNFSSSATKNDVSVSIAQLSFGINQFVPEVQMPVKANTYPFSLYIGNAPIFGKWNAAFPQIWSGFYSESEVANNGLVTSDAFGYLNTQNAAADDMVDFSRTPIEYSKHIPNLGPSSFNYDIYTLSGQGTGGMFRPERSDVRFLHDPDLTQENNSLELSVEAANSSAIYHVGVDFFVENGITQSGDWTNGTSNASSLQSSSTDKDYEPAYFKIYGEHTGDFYNDYHSDFWKGDSAVRFKLNKTSGGWYNDEYELTDDFVYDETHAGSPNATVSSDLALKNKRQKRTRTIHQVSNGDADDFGFEKNLQYFNSSGTSTAKNFSHNSNHISEMHILQPDGMRYYYGLPAYNKTHIDQNGSVPDSDFENGKLRKFSTVASNSHLLNVSGTGGVTTQFLNRTEIPEYVHSWLLSTVASSDYADVTSNGPTDDDLGYWVKFKYSMPYNDYKWRVPYQNANFNAGSTNDPLDNTAYYSYGTKEIYYIKTIETKTHIAVFYTSEREDALEAYSEYADSSQKGTRALHKLDKIELYVKEEYQTAQNPVPIQTVHFKYSYDLCPNVPNNTGDDIDEDGNSVSQGDPDNVNADNGKLTLTKVYFTYQNSERGKSSPYIFDYNEEISSENPDYNSLNIDRWGNYYDFEGQYYNGLYPYQLYPSTAQDETGGAYSVPVGQWSVKKIILPTGGEINITYESDDYAYVEDKPAMQIFDIVGLGDAGAPSSIPDRNTSGTLDIGYTTDELQGTNDKFYRIYINLGKNAGTQPDEVAWVKEKLIGDIEKMWFKTYIGLKNSSDYEYVSGYADIVRSSSGTGLTDAQLFGLESVGTGSPNNNVAYITVKAVDLNDVFGQTHPFRKAAYQYLKLQRPELIHNLIVQDGSTASLIFSVMGIFFNNFSDVFQTLLGGYYNFCQVNGYADDIKLNGRSVVRLLEPDKKKYGGGVRVKSLKMYDNWIAASGFDAEYGQEYFYDTNGDGTGTSTGVAYEPSVFREESALIEPIEFEQSQFAGTSYNLFLEKPLLENYYPGASVGYSKVTVKSIAPAEASAASNTIENTAAPYSVYEYYTPKDFPVYYDETDMNGDPAIVRPIVIPGIFTGSKIKKARSQGYCIVMNDMAGKPKAVASYRRFPTNNASTNMLSRQEYIYQTVEPYHSEKVNKLSNRVQVLNNSSQFQSAVIGETFDVFVDRNENKTTSTGFGADFNVEIAPSLFALIPIPRMSESETSMKTVVVMKTIHRSGILKETKVTTDQSTISTENLAYDILTGDPLLTKVTNEHDDPIYNYSYPAHWYYAGMGAAYKNIGVTFTGLTSGSYGEITGFGTANVGNFFSPGDEVYAIVGGSGSRCHVVKVDAANNKIVLVYNTGAFFNTGQTISSLKIIRSGYKNMITASAGSVSFKNLVNFHTNVQSAAANYSFDLKSVINAMAVEFSESWQVPCEGCGEGVPSNLVTYAVNPYLSGLKGNFRPKKSYAFIVDRVYNNNSKEDGVYEDFVAFNWANPSADNRWIAAAEITKYSPFGFELENKDALGIFSGALYGYNKNLVTAIAKNSRYNEMAFDGFEDYGMMDTCDNNTRTDNHFRFSETADMVSTYAHTGKKSFKVINGDSSYISRTWYDMTDCDSYTGNPGNPTGTRGYYQRDSCDCLGKFNLQKGTDKKYVVSAWAKQVNGATVYTTYDKAKVSVTYNGTTYASSVFGTSGPIIEGWQRIYGEFNLPSNATGFTLALKNEGGSGTTVYFDDLRIHPYKGNMVSYVYDVITLKLLAELDANNFATFYVYDEAGHLNKIKKETVDGIKTIKEGRISNARQ
ncbi:MAG: hypothetical protein ACOZCO_00990 [Bacteroidota bacterium]